jgi:hypothetical protein
MGRHGLWAQLPLQNPGKRDYQSDAEAVALRKLHPTHVRAPDVFVQLQLHSRAHARLQDP